MSSETGRYLNGGNILIGFGHHAWWRNDALTVDGAEQTHYPASIPAADVARRLFNWTVETAPVYVETIHGRREVPGKVATYRSDTGHPFGVVSTKYGTHQYVDSLLRAAEKITDTDLGVGIESAGLLGNGARAWLSISLADTVTNAVGVEYLPRLLLAGSHDGSLSSIAKRCVQLTVCDNTLAIALAEKTGHEYRVKHTRHSALRVETAQDALGILTGTVDEFDRQLESLCAESVTDRQWQAFLDAYAPIPELAPGQSTRALTLAETKRDSLSTLWNNDPRCSPWKGTAWGVVQTCNTWATWEQTVRGMSRSERNMNATLEGQWDAFDASTLATLRPILANV